MNPRELFVLDPEITFLNHGSFGACPRPVLEAQAVLRARMEREPVLFLHREHESRLDEARHALATLVGAEAEQLAFVPNATAGVNTVLRSLRLSASDEVVVTDHTYAACRNAADEIARVAGARVVVAQVPFPIDSPDRVFEAVISALSSRTKLVLIDHVTSPTGLVFPVERITRACAERGVDVLIDGAHAPGMIPLELDRLGAAYYTGNCHKWLCTPKGCALLYVRRDKQAHIRPMAVSHGASSRRTDRSRFRLEFDFTGTDDPTAYLAVPEAIRVLSGLLPGGLPALMASNRAKALAARAPLLRVLGIPAPAPDEMIGSLVALPIPDSRGDQPKNPFFADALMEILFEKYRIEVPVFPWPGAPKRLIRIAAQVYNTHEQYEALAAALKQELG